MSLWQGSTLIVADRNQICLGKIIEDRPCLGQVKTAMGCGAHWHVTVSSKRKRKIIDVIVDHVKVVAVFEGARQLHDGRAHVVSSALIEAEASLDARYQPGRGL